MADFIKYRGHGYRLKKLLCVCKRMRLGVGCSAQVPWRVIDPSIDEGPPAWGPRKVELTSISGYPRFPRMGGWAAPVLLWGYRRIDLLIFSTNQDGVAKSPPYGVTAFFQDLDIHTVCLRPWKNTKPCRPKFLLSHLMSFCESTNQEIWNRVQFLGFDRRSQ
jgi:hypothetical protein